MIPKERVVQLRGAIAALPRAARPDIVDRVLVLALRSADRRSGVIELCPRCFASGARTRASGLADALRELERLGAVSAVPGARNPDHPGWPVWRVGAPPVERAEHAD